MLFSGLAELLGIATLLPLLKPLMSGASSPQSKLEAALAESLNFIGLSPSLPILLSILVLALWIKGGLLYFTMRQVGYAAGEVALELRVKLINALMGARWRYYTGAPIGTFATALGVESRGAAATVQAAFTVVSHGLQAAFYILLALVLDPLITLGAVTAGITLSAILSRFVGLARQAGKIGREAYDALIVRITDELAGIKAIKAMARERELSNLLEGEIRNLNLSNRRLVVAKEAVQSMREPLVVFFLAPGFFFAHTYLNMPVELLIVMAYVFYRAVNVVGNLQQQYQNLASSESYYHAMYLKIEDAERESEKHTGTRKPLFSQKISFEDVGLSLGGTTIIDDVSLEIKVGEITAIIGRSGVGKTTLTDFIVGLRTPDSGRIAIDGITLDQIDMSVWRKNIGYVPQEILLFPRSILDNVTLGDPSLSEHAAEQALRLAGAWDFIESLPAQLATIAGERGYKISGGQRQRIALARALIRKPKLLILDEPTTALDPQTEAAICETLGKLAGDTTILVVSHQPAIIDIADTVYHIHDGHVTKNFKGSPHMLTTGSA